MSENTDFYSDVGSVRINLGDFDEPFRLPDDVIIIKLQEYASQSEATRIWNASVDCLKILLNKFALNASRLREREGGVEIEEYRNEIYQALKERYKELINNPPAELETTLMIFGGTSCKESNRVKNNSDNIRTSFGVDSFRNDGDYILQRGD